MVVSEDIQLLKEQLHLHYGSTWEQMTERTQTSHFAARTGISRNTTGTQRFLDAWGRLPEYVAHAVAKGNLFNSVEAEVVEEEEEANDSELPTSEADILSSTCNSVDLAVRSWERAHEAKEGKLSEQDKAVCKELMSSCFERLSTLHERRVQQLEEVEKLRLEQELKEAPLIAARAGAEAAAAKGAAVVGHRVKSIHGERLRKGQPEREFLVHWHGCGESERTWQPESSISAPRLIREFRERSKKAKARAKRKHAA